MWIEVDLLFAFTSIFDLLSRLSQNEKGTQSGVFFVLSAGRICIPYDLWMREWAWSPSAPKRRCSEGDMGENKKHRKRDQRTAETTMFSTGQLKSHTLQKKALIQVVSRLSFVAFCYSLLIQSTRTDIATVWIQSVCADSDDVSWYSTPALCRRKNGYNATPWCWQLDDLRFTRIQKRLLCKHLIFQIR